MSVLTSVIHTMDSSRLLVYCPISSPNGTQLCAVDDWAYMYYYQWQEPETFEHVKLSSCALSTMASNSAVFTYNRTDGHCVVFKSSPWYYEHVDGCVTYEVTRLR